MARLRRRSRFVEIGSNFGDKGGAEIPASGIINACLATIHGGTADCIWEQNEKDFSHQSLGSLMPPVISVYLFIFLHNVVWLYCHVLFWLSFFLFFFWAFFDTFLYRKLWDSGEFTDLISHVCFGCAKQWAMHLLTQIITDLPRSDEVISYVKMPSDCSDNEEPVTTINLTERLKIDHRVLI